ncbi:hypothetical protein COCMIDRAFT_86020 [Bipolaris oryzae ATCC 44560]|uniref:Uncharacterized protein n=1 Tax=Bipolaris oryzae ATCC 44560 TaxID=930090 RepID=W6ZB02_COCMI|nr:uncharacterized protein COCMIDRAFT_86020 [Bipolaris oryzae ATCC 44560]EUC48957.1 hypothetical protein COCMIDRAFT_86020 [Bipolaris oryzae ATCC 44560]
MNHRSQNDRTGRPPGIQRCVARSDPNACSFLPSVSIRSRLQFLRLRYWKPVELFRATVSHQKIILKSFRGVTVNNGILSISTIGREAECDVSS